MFDFKLPESQAAGKHGLQTPPGKDSPPPSYTVNDSNNVPDITAAFSNLDLTTSHTTEPPSPDKCIAHLKLLEAFHQLREEVALTDGLFGIKDAFAPPETSGAKRAEVLTKIREKRWAVYVAKAAERFEKWWETCIEPEAQPLKQKEIVVAFSNGPTGGPPLAFGQKHIPPLGKSSSPQSSKSPRQ